MYKRSRRGGARRTPEACDKVVSESAAKRAETTGRTAGAEAMAVPNQLRERSSRGGTVRRKKRGARATRKDEAGRTRNKEG